MSISGPVVYACMWCGPVGGLRGWWFLSQGGSLIVNTAPKSHEKLRQHIYFFFKEFIYGNRLVHKFREFI